MHSIYIHIPFCQKKCPYCDFNSYATSNAELSAIEEKYVNALIKDLECQITKYLSESDKCKSVFFGGGTPSLLSSHSIDRLLSFIESKMNLNGCEVTMEVNPRSIVEDLSELKLKAFKDKGINRISIGAQSFQQDKLNFLGRWHSPQDTIKTFQLARSAGFDNINLDLIFGAKDETLSCWQYDIDQVVSLNPEHVSCYMLTMEPGTEFGKRTKKGEVLIVDEDDFLSFYSETTKRLIKSGYSQYEISNYSKTGKECHHNLHYWLGGEYLAVGAGAHGFCKSSLNKGLRWANTPSPINYIKRIETEGNAIQNTDQVGELELYIEYISFGLRMSRGIKIKSGFDFIDIRLNAFLDSKEFKFFEENKMLEIQGETLVVPPSSFHIADGIVSEIITYHS